MTRRGNNHLICLLSLILLLCTSFIHADKRITTILMPHSPSIDGARELAGIERFIDHADDEAYGVIAINPLYNKTFRPDRIAQCFFGDAILDYHQTFTVSGSQTDRADSHWLADYFGLPTDFQSYVRVNPQISNIVLDLDIFVGQVTAFPGLYFSAHAPLIRTRWKLGMCETIISTGSQAYDAGYFNASGIERKYLNNSFSEFIMGRAAPAADDFTFHQLSYAKMNRCKSKVGIGDIQLALGWNAFHQKAYHLGVELRGTIPTGNRPRGTWLFEPIVGNGHHWELGGGLSGHIRLWHDEDEEVSVNVYGNLHMTHLFSSHQHRSFDLCSSLNSRYMLAQKMTDSISYNLRGVVDGERVTPTAQYYNEVTTVANLTTLPVDVHVKLQTDLAFLLNYTDAKNSWGFGYGYWHRSCECVSICGQTPFETERWALKGDAHLYGFENNSEQTPIALSATESKATIHAGTNFARAGATTQTAVASGRKNSAVDNPALAVADSNGDGIFLSVMTTAGGTDQIYTSIQPILLTRNDIDIESAQTKGAAHKIFSHYTHTLALSSSFPYIGFGGEIEFGPTAYCPGALDTKAPECVNTAVSFWEIWIKGGVAF